MTRTRINYWSCSKFADWVRGEKKPYALPHEEWEEWRNKQKSERPFRFWISDTVLNKIQHFFLSPSDIYNEIKYYYRNRFITKTHCLKTGLEPGSYHELDERILHGLFNELVEFIEVEKAWLNHIYHKEKKFKFKNGRCPEAGLDYLNWEISLKWDEDSGFNKDDKEYGEPTPQATVAKKTLKLYEWWKNTRPNRPEPMEESGWNNYYFNKDKYTREEVSLISEKIQEIEEAYENEDEEMMIELIKIRRSLWT